MLTYEDCLGFCDLTREEIDAIAHHERLPEIVALELGQYLVQSPEGVFMIKRMIIDDLEQAQACNDLNRYLILKATLKHFIDTHPDNVPDAA